MVLWQDQGCSNIGVLCVVGHAMWVCVVGDASFDNLTSISALQFDCW